MYTPNEEQLEMMKKQWAAMGMDPDQMLKFMSNAQEMMIEAQQKIMEQAASDETADEDEDALDLADLLDFENVPSLREESDITDEAVLKAIACGSNLAFLNCQYLNTLETYKPLEQTLAMLELDWGVESREDLLEMLAWLENEGHRKEFDLLWNKLKGVPQAEWAGKIKETSLQLLTQGIDIENLHEHAANMMLGYSLMKKKGCFRNMKSPKIHSWDLGRAINLVRWGYDVQFLNKEEAIGLIQGYAAQLKSVYNSWDALSEGYLLGFMMWCGDEEEFEELYEDHQVLLTHDDSPWLIYRW